MVLIIAPIRVKKKVRIKDGKIGIESIEPETAQDQEPPTENQETTTDNQAVTEESKTD